MKASFYQYTYKNLCKILEENQLSTSGASLLYNWHYKQKQITLCTHNLAVKTQHFLKKHFNFDLPQIISVHESNDNTVKFLIQMNDGLSVETPNSFSK